MKNTFLFIAVLLSSFNLFGSDTLNVNQELSFEEQFELYSIYVDSIESTFTYETGKIELKNNIASIIVPLGFKYLNAEDSDMVLTELWGNPPSEGSDKTLGMLFQENSSLMSDTSYAINITYSEEGFIKDDDAKDLDYDDLLETMQGDVEEVNTYRIEAGYEPIELVGWASQPFYDQASKKLHWAKELRFGDADVSTLNYNIRVLGRKGYLELNAISEIGMLTQVQDNIEPILSSVDFNDGHKYSDFNPDIDKVAAYGIGGLIAGKVLLKAGILAKAGLLLAKFWKVIALGLLAFGAGIKSFFFGKKEEEIPTPNSEQDV